jgi:hypothetical protein
MKLDLLTNARVVDDAIRFVTQKGAANTEQVWCSSYCYGEGKTRALLRNIHL